MGSGHRDSTEKLRLAPSRLSLDRQSLTGGSCGGPPEPLVQRFPFRARFGLHLCPLQVRQFLTSPPKRSTKGYAMCSVAVDCYSFPQLVTSGACITAVLHFGSAFFPELQPWFSVSVAVRHPLKQTCF